MNFDLPRKSRVLFFPILIIALLGLVGCNLGYRYFTSTEEFVFHPNDEYALVAVWSKLMEYKGIHEPGLISFQRYDFSNKKLVGRLIDFGNFGPVRVLLDHRVRSFYLGRLPEGDYVVRSVTVDKITPNNLRHSLEVTEYCFEETLVAFRVKAGTVNVVEVGQIINENASAVLEVKGLLKKLQTGYVTADTFSAKPLSILSSEEKFCSTKQFFGPSGPITPNSLLTNDL